MITGGDAKFWPTTAILDFVFQFRTDVFSVRLISLLGPVYLFPTNGNTNEDIHKIISAGKKINELYILK